MSDTTYYIEASEIACFKSRFKVMAETPEEAERKFLQGGNVQRVSSDTIVKEPIRIVRILDFHLTEFKPADPLMRTQPKDAHYD